MPPGVFVVVSGPPASGKTTLARAIAPAVGLPLIAKDTIKEALMAVLPVPDVAASRVVGRASVAALLAVAAQSGGAVQIRSRLGEGTTVELWLPRAHEPPSETVGGDQSLLVMSQDAQHPIL